MKTYYKSNLNIENLIVNLMNKNELCFDRNEFSDFIVTDKSK